MKTKYNNIIEWIIIIILAAPFIALLALKLFLKGIAKLLKVIQAIVRVSMNYIILLKGELVKALSVKEVINVTPQTFKFLLLKDLIKKMKYKPYTHRKHL